MNDRPDPRRTDRVRSDASAEDSSAADPSDLAAGQPAAAQSDAAQAAAAEPNTPSVPAHAEPPVRPARALGVWRGITVAIATLAGGLLIALLLGRGGLELKLAFWVSVLFAWVAFGQLRYQRRCQRYAWTKPRRLRFTRFGVFHALLSLAVGLLAVHTQLNLLHLIFGAQLALIIASGALAQSNLTGLKIRRRVPEEVFAGEPTAITFSVTNTRKRRPIYSLWLFEGWPRDLPRPESLPAVYVARIPPLQTTSVTYHMALPRRGAFRFVGLTCATRYPFSLFVRYRYFSDTAEVLVYPKRRARPQVAEPAGTATPHLTPHDHSMARGSGDFHALRPYVPGSDPVRAVHWRSSAHYGDLMVRELERETEGPRWILLELGRAGARLEAVIECAAALVEDAFRAGRPFTVAIPPAQTAGPPARTPKHRGRCLELLARLEGLPERAGAPTGKGATRLLRREVAGAARPTVSPGSSVVAIVGDGHEAFSGWCRRFAGPGTQLVVVTPSD